MYAFIKGILHILDDESNLPKVCFRYKLAVLNQNI